MELFRRLFSPLVVFIGVQIAWILVVVFWILWFTDVHSTLRNLAETQEIIRGHTNWVILIEGLLLLVAILAGVYVIFLFWGRQASLYRAQRDFISQVSHELKSPLASIQLHLETIRRRRPSPEKLEVFLDTMLDDTERLQNLIDNLLSAGRVQQRGQKLPLMSGDLSSLVMDYFGARRYALPRAGRMHLKVEPDLQVMLDPESLETVFRNLLENAILYSEGPPDISVNLFREGESAHLVVADKGRGLGKKDRKKVFGMFYRVRRVRETIRGSGLGLFIAKRTIGQHRGRIWLESMGTGKGTAVHIRLPLQRKTVR